MNTPAVSIILPTYNRAPLLPRAIHSVRRQTFTDWDLWIVDDGSTDQTREIVAQIADARIHYLYQRHQGVAAARNYGISASQAALIAFQDSDDTWTSEKLEKQVRVMVLNESLQVVFSQFIRQKGQSTHIFPQKSDVQTENIYAFLLWGNFITPQAALVRRQALQRAGGFDRRLPCLVDWDLWLRLARDYRFAFIPEPLVNVYATQGSVSQDPGVLSRAMSRIFAKHLRDLPDEKALKAYHLYRIGHLLLLSGEEAEGKAYLERAIRSRPGVVRRWPAWIAARLGTNMYRRLYALKAAIRPEWY